MDQIFPCSTCANRERNWFKETFIGDIYMRCNRPGQGTDIVTGKMRRAFLILERQYPSPCGVEGKFHSQRKES